MDPEAREELSNLIDDYVRAEGTIAEIMSKGYSDTTLLKAEREKYGIAEEIVDLVAIAIFNRHGWGIAYDSE